MKNIVGSKNLDASNNETVEVINPATGEVIDTVPASTEEDVDQVVTIAEEAQKKWAKVPLHERGRILEKFVDLVEENKEELALLLCRETGKPITEARAEIGNTRTFVYGYIEKAKHLYGITIPAGVEVGEEKTIQMTIREPLGVVACIIPFNFPCDLFGQGIPAGVINCISGNGSIVGHALAKHKGVHLISVTGSTKVGMETMKTASDNLSHVMLELGGNDAFIVDKDGDLDLAVEELVWGRLYNTGQVCCASKRFLIHDDIKEEFTARVIEKLNTLKVGMPEEEDAQIGCLITEEAAETVEEQVRKTLEEGAHLAYGGRRNKAFFEPTILTDVTKEMEVMKDMEIFGPVIPICGFKTIEEAIEIANQSSYGLCGNIITSNMKTAFKVATELEVGGAIVNGASFYRSAEMPFGGWKHSGIGNEGISTTLEEMSRIKTIVLKNILED